MNRFKLEAKKLIKAQKALMKDHVAKMKIKQQREYEFFTGIRKIIGLSDEDMQAMVECQTRILVDDYTLQVNSISMLAIGREAELYLVVASNKTGFIVTEGEERAFYAALEFYQNNRKVISKGPKIIPIKKAIVKESPMDGRINKDGK